MNNKHINATLIKLIILMKLMYSQIKFILGLTLSLVHVMSVHYNEATPKSHIPRFTGVYLIN